MEVWVINFGKFWLSFFLLFWWPILVLWLYERSWNSCDCCFLYNNEKTCNSIFLNLKSDYLREAINWGTAKYLRKFGISLCAPGPSCSKGGYRKSSIKLPRGLNYFKPIWGGGLIEMGGLFGRGGGLFHLETTMVSVLHKELDCKVEKLKYKKF